jgi:hypothetical protein
MATTTPNFGWSVPTSSDLVKNGATAIETLGDSIDASLVDLKGGTTGQVLAKATDTDMDFTWTTAGGSSVNKNYLINGGFAVAQRGTSFTASANNDDAYTLDRWYILSDTNDVIDVTQETTTVPTNGQFAIALDVETVNKKFGIATIIENKDVIGLVGNTVTFSFKAKVSATTKLDNVKAAIVAWSGTADTVTSDIISAWGAEGTNPTLIANATYENSPANLSLTTSYATYSVSAAVDTASTKNLILFIWSDVTDTTAGDFLYIAESKLELGSTATAFVYAGETTQGELAACQRYFIKYGGQEIYEVLAQSGSSTSATASVVWTIPPVTMRSLPTVTHSALSDFNVHLPGTQNVAASSLVFSTTESSPACFTLNIGHGSNASFGGGKSIQLSANNTVNARLNFSAEL